jgi:hypothetical protein
MGNYHFKIFAAMHVPAARIASIHQPTIREMRDRL